VQALINAPPERALPVLKKVLASQRSIKVKKRALFVLSQLETDEAMKVVLDAAKTDDLDKFRAAVMKMDVPVGSLINGWGVKFDESGQNSNERVQHYMLQWQNGSLVTVWPEDLTSNRAKWVPLGPWQQRK
jgi:hypothetical protein